MAIMNVKKKNKMKFDGVEKMHCYKCERIIETVPGAEDFPIYDMSRKVYRNEKAIVLECSSCRELIVIINYQSQDIEMIVIDESLQT